MVVPRTWCMLKWKRTVYDLQISILSMSVAKILSKVNCVQMIFDLTNSVLEWTNASSSLYLMRCIFHFTTLSTATLWLTPEVFLISTRIMSKNCEHSAAQNFLWSILYLRRECISVFSLSVSAGFSSTVFYVYYFRIYILLAFQSEAKIRPSGVVVVLMRPLNL